MSEAFSGASGAEPIPTDTETVFAAEPTEPPADERAKSTTVGTGSYVAVSCTVMALALTFGILGVLLVLRALGWA